MPWHALGSLPLMSGHRSSGSRGTALVRIRRTSAPDEPASAFRYDAKDRANRRTILAHRFRVRRKMAATLAGRRDSPHWCLLARQPAPPVGPTSLDPVALLLSARENSSRQAV